MPRTAWQFQSISFAVGTKNACSCRRGSFERIGTFEPFAGGFDRNGEAPGTGLASAFT